MFLIIFAVLLFCWPLFEGRLILPQDTTFEEKRRGISSLGAYSLSEDSHLEVMEKILTECEVPVEAREEFILAPLEELLWLSVWLQEDCVFEWLINKVDDSYLNRRLIGWGGHTLLGLIATHPEPLKVGRYADVVLRRGADPLISGPDGATLWIAALRGRNVFFC